MKKGKKTASLLLLILFASIKSHAYDFEVDGIYYGYDANNQTAYVTYDWQKKQSYMATYSGSITIPSTVSYNGRTLNVSAIGEEAFYNCKDLYSISIPNSVTKIGEYNQEIKGKTNVEIIPVSA